MADNPVDLVVTNGKIITVDPGDSLAEAVAVRGNRIAAVGGAAEISTLTGPNTRVIDAGGKAVIPGLIDGHSHMDREGLKPVFEEVATTLQRELGEGCDLRLGPMKDPVRTHEKCACAFFEKI